MTSSGDDLFPERFVPETMHGLIEAEHLARYRWAATWAGSQRVLDAGCGAGYGLQMMHAAGAAALSGVDIAHEAVAAARQLLGQAAQVEQADLAALPFSSDSFDLVLCFETIEHVACQDRALDELQRVLSKTGLLLISSPNPDVYPAGNPHHHHEFRPGELRTALSERFGHVELASQHPWLASLICGEEALGEANAKRPMDGLLYKIAALPRGQETFSLALASDVPLPPVGALATITTPDDLDAWRSRALSAEEHLESAVQQIADAAQQHAELDNALTVRSQATARAQTERDLALVTLAEAEQRGEQRELGIERLQRMLAERNAALRLATQELDALGPRMIEFQRELKDARDTIATYEGSLGRRFASAMRFVTGTRRR